MRKAWPYHQSGAVITAPYDEADAGRLAV